jgi:hypothetical protein
MIEKRLKAITPRLLISNGTLNGSLAIKSTRPFKVKQYVIVSATSFPPLELEIKEINAPTELIVGPRNGSINTRTDISAYTVALSASILANEQKRPSIPFEEITRAVYAEEPIVANRSVLVDQDGEYIGNVDDKLKVESSTPQDKQDAFGNSIVVEPSVIFATHFSNSSHSSFLWNKRETTGGTVTHDLPSSSVLLNVTTANGSRAEYQTFRSFQYIPGQALEYIMTQVFVTPKANQIQRVGVRDIDASDGIYFECDSVGMNVVVKGVSTEKIARANWYDPLDGSGPSGWNANFTKGQIMIIHYQWLGYGDVEFGIQVGNRFIKCHTIEHNNTLIQPYTHTPSFNGFSEIVNTGTVASTSSMRLGCFAVKAYGDAIVGNGIVPASNETALTSVGGSVYAALLAVRFKSSMENTEVILEKINIFSNSVTDLHYKLLFNPTVTGGSWVSTGESLEKNITLTSYSGGYEFYSDYTQKQSGVNIADIGSFMRLGRYIDGTSNTILVVAKSLGGNVNTGTSLIFKELL